MFTSFNIFDFFSRYTFSRFESYSRYGNDSQPSIGTNGTSGPVPTAPVQEIPENVAPVEETPKDTIEISGDTPKTAEESPVYKEGDIVPANEPSDDDGQPVAVSEPHDNGLVSQVKSSAKINLKMIFNLADFEAVVSSFAEDAEDGQIDTASYSNLNIGLHTDLKAKAHIKEMYRNQEGEEGALQEMKFKQKSRSEQFEASLLKSRGFEADMFYRESLKTSNKIKYSYNDGFMKISRKMHMRYKQDFGLSLQSLNFYNSQAEALDQTNNLQGYLDSAEALVDSPNTSGELLNGFFQTVESYLNGAEDKLIEKIDMFFENLAAEMGVDVKSLSGAKEALLANVGGFFDRVENAVSSSKSRYIAPAPEPEPEPVEPPEEELVGIADTVAA